MDQNYCTRSFGHDSCIEVSNFRCLRRSPEKFSERDGQMGAPQYASQDALRQVYASQNRQEQVPSRNPRSRVPNPESRIPDPESRIPNPGSRKYSRRSSRSPHTARQELNPPAASLRQPGSGGGIIPDPESRIPDPESKAAAAARIEWPGTKWPGALLARRSIERSNPGECLS